MIENGNSSMPYMKSLATCVNRMITEGFSEDFKVVEERLFSINKQRYYKPEEVQVVNFFRFEDMSDPNDNAVLYVLETADGTRGILIDAYGIYNDPSIGRFITQVTETEKVLK